MPAEAEQKKIPKFKFLMHKGERRNRFVQFAENVQLLRNRMHRQK